MHEFGKEDGVAIIRIVVADCIVAGNLFKEEGYDVEKSADNLADLRGQIIMDYLEAEYPGTEIYADIAIQREAGPERPVEVMAYESEECIDTAVSATIREHLQQLLGQRATDRSWVARTA